MLAIQRVGVVGAGTMGNGIAHVFARNGFQVLLCDVEQRFLDRGLEAIRKNLEREAAKGKTDCCRSAAAMSAIRGTLTGSRSGGMRFRRRSRSEKFEIKQEIFCELDAMLRPEVILASNTSSISITKLGGADQAAGQSDRHAFLQSRAGDEAGGGDPRARNHRRNICPGESTGRTLGKTPVEVNDAPGFVSNRVLMPLLNEAMYAVMEGVATAEAVDEVFKLGMAHPMGPLTLADFIGLDVCLDIMRVLLEGLGDPKYRPCPLLINMVDAGWLGRKSGRGFYHY